MAAAASSTFDLLAPLLFSPADPLPLEIFLNQDFNAKFSELFSQHTRAKEERVRCEDRFRDDKRVTTAVAALGKHCRSLLWEDVDPLCSLNDHFDAVEAAITERDGFLEGYIEVLKEEAKIQQDISDWVARFTTAMSKERASRIQRRRNNMLWTSVAVGASLGVLFALVTY